MIQKTVIAVNYLSKIRVSQRVLSFSIAGLIASTSLVAVDASAGSKGFFRTAIESIENNSSTTVAATGTVEVAFSPNEGSEALVLKVINSSKSEIRMLAYSFTSAPVVQALLNAKHRGVDVKLVVDYKANVTEDHSGKSRAGLSALSLAGADVRTISVYPIHHDKTIVVDANTVELGSFNYSAAAAHSNSENVLVNWNNPSLAKPYLQHFMRNYQQSKPYSQQ